MTDTATRTNATPYDMVGGSEIVRKVVDRFYDLMDDDPTYAALRALHAPDLAPMRDSLAGFLNAWMGGPRDWFEQRPGMCMMSAHKGVTINPDVARQWADAMSRAVTDSVPDQAIAPKMAEALSGLALGMGGVQTR